MLYLLIYLAVTMVGYIIGAQFRKRGMTPSWVGKLMTFVLIILVFLMGSRIGDNEQILASLDTIGLIALVYTLIIMAFACLFFTIARRLFGFDRYGIRHKGEGGLHRHSEKQAQKAAATADVAAENAADVAADAETKAAPINGLTILIVVFVALGILAGYFVLPDSIMVHSGNLLTLALCMLLIFIGMDIGIEGTIAKNFKSAGWRIIAFPFVSILSMLAGSVVAALILPIGLQDSLCIGSGLGWYSLAPAMLADYSMKVSAISFMHNVFREVLGLISVSIIAKKVGYIESYACPGCTSMDVTLPVVEKSTSADIAVYSFIHGAILSASVPILVSIFMGI